MNKSLKGMTIVLIILFIALFLLRWNLQSTINKIIYIPMIIDDSLNSKDSLFIDEFKNVFRGKEKYFDKLFINNSSDSLALLLDNIKENNFVISIVYITNEKYQNLINDKFKNASILIRDSLDNNSKILTKLKMDLAN